jgi:hypothetical protein
MGDPRPLDHWVPSGAGVHCLGEPEWSYDGLELSQGQCGRSESGGGVLQPAP